MGEVERNFEVVDKLLLQWEKSKMAIFRMYGRQYDFQLGHILWSTDHRGQASRAHASVSYASQSRIYSHRDNCNMGKDIQIECRI